MPSLKCLQAIAHDLLGTFVSRNNDIDGYWALGVLYQALFDKEPCVFELDLWNIDRAYPEHYQYLHSIYFHKLIFLLQSYRLPLTCLESAIIQVQFRATSQAKLPLPTWARGELFLADVTLKKCDKRLYVASQIGWCGVHDPHLEIQSTRRKNDD